MKKDLVSIIVRTKNEGFWIGKCLHAIENQYYKNFEIIIVDNNSSENTIKIIKKNFPKTKIVHYKSKAFLPGRALNLGISKSKGKYIVMISGHCIPKNNKWLGSLVRNIKLNNVAGCYGKQEPLDMSNPNDVRDLYYLFGKDKKIQTKDPFFHNANSIIKKSLWRKYRFDERTNHIEDRLWAQEVQNKKFKIIYEPDACVYHFHGVSHSHNISRVSKITRIITKTSITKKPNFCAIAVIKQPILKKNKKYLIKEAVEELIKIKKIFKIFIVTDDIGIRKEIKNKKVIFLKRPYTLSEEILGSDQILKDVFSSISKKYKPTHFLSFEEVNSYRPKNFFSKLLKNYDDNYDCLVPISRFNKDHNIWKKNDAQMEIVYKTSLPSSINKHSIYREIKGLGCIVKSSNVEANGRESVNTKFFEVPNKFAFRYDSSLIKLINKFQ
jgi:glycosyltransferase involved in cell wall biosynthesis